MTWTHSSFKESSDEHYTPKWIFDELQTVFDLDVAGSENSCVPAVRIYTKEIDGLSQAWNGFIWMNPPYSKPTPWVEKFIQHNNGVALLPVTKGRWFDALWDGDTVIALLPYNQSFERPSEKPKQITFRTVLIGMGQGKEVVTKYKKHKSR